MNDLLSGQSPLSRRRRLLKVALGCLIFLILPASLYWFLTTKADRELQAILADLDRREPEGWRLEDLEARRPTLSDEENAALCVLAVQQAMRPVWPPLQAMVDDGDLRMIPLVDQRLSERPAPVLLDAALAQDLRAAMQDAAPAVKLSRRLRDLSRGRYPIQWSPNVVGFLLTSPDARPVAHMMSWQARLEAHDQQIPVALATCRDLVGVARSIDDEPLTNSQFIRLSIQGITVNTLQMVLAQGEATAADLGAIQTALEKEASVPVMLHSARGERALAYEISEGLKDGRVTPIQVGAAPLLASLGPSGTAFWVGRSQARMMEFLNDFVDIAQLPADEQRQAHADIQEEIKRAIFKEKHPLIQLLVPALDRANEAYQRMQARLRCTLLALAAERYRLDHGHWPERAEQLVPRYLAAVPNDPFGKQPIRWKTLRNGLVFYSVGPDGVDNGGLLDERNPVAKGTDLGFRLWHVSYRRQQAAESLPLPGESPLEGEMP